MGAALVLPPSVRAHKGVVPFPADRRVAHVRVGGLKIACLSRRELASLMVSQCLERRARRSGRPKLVFAANGHAISLAARNAKFRRQHELADLIHADGQPVVFASRFTRSPIPERSATTDFFHDAAEAAREHGLRIFLLGGRDEVNARCAALMQNMYPGLKIVGRQHGYFSKDEEAAVCKRINDSQADIVWVGLGVPLEQDFCIRNRDRLKAGWLVTAGGCYSYVTGDYARAPGWMQRAGLEWLHRLWREPRRLFLRYALTNPHAAFLLLTRTASLKPAARALASEESRLQHELS